MLVKLASLQAFAKPLPKEECSWARVSNRGPFPRTDMGATPAFEGWGGTFTDPKGDGFYGDRD